MSTDRDLGDGERGGGVGSTPAAPVFEQVAQTDRIGDALAFAAVAALVAGLVVALWH